MLIDGGHLGGHRGGRDDAIRDSGRGSDCLAGGGFVMVNRSDMRHSSAGRTAPLSNAGFARSVSASLRQGLALASTPPTFPGLNLARGNRRPIMG